MAGHVSDHIEDATRLLTLITVLINIAITVAGVAQSWLNGRKAKKQLEISARTEKTVTTLEVNTNSIKDALVASEKKSSLQEGTAEGLVKGHAAGLEQGRNEERPHSPDQPLG